MHIYLPIVIGAGPRLITARTFSITVAPPILVERPIQRTREGGSERELIKILLKGDTGSNKMNTTSNTRLRLTTQVGQDHAATGVLLALGTNNQLHGPENAAEHQPRALLTYTGQASEHHRSDRSLLVKPGNFHRTAPTPVRPM
jgi:hypothetical protein